MKSKEEKLRVAWTGNNFPEIYALLARNSMTKNFKIKLIESGRSATTSIEIINDNARLVLNVGDWIVAPQGDVCFVIENYDV